MIGGRFSKKMIYFVAVSAIALFFASLLQTSFLPALDLFGAIPDFVLILVCGVAFYLGAVEGAVFGLVGGILLDAFGSAGVMISPVFYVAMGILFGTFSFGAFANKFMNWMICCGTFCLLKAIYSMLAILLFSGELKFWAAFGMSVVPEFFGTLLLSVALFFPLKWLAGLLRGRMNVKKGKGGLGNR